MRVQLPPRPVLRTVQATLRLGGCARSRLGARGGKAAGEGMQLVSWGKGALLLPSPGSCSWIPPKPGRAPGSRRKWWRAERRPNQAHFTFGNSWGNRVRYDVTSISRKINPTSRAIAFDM
jgi:hypothetical protein